MSSEFYQLNTALTTIDKCFIGIDKKKKHSIYISQLA